MFFTISLATSDTKKLIQLEVRNPQRGCTGLKSGLLFCTFWERLYFLTFFSLCLRATCFNRLMVSFPIFKGNCGGWFSSFGFTPLPLPFTCEIPCKITAPSQNSLPNYTLVFLLPCKVTYSQVSGIGGLSLWGLLSCLLQFTIWLPKSQVHFSCKMHSLPSNICKSFNPLQNLLKFQSSGSNSGMGEILGAFNTSINPFYL